MKIRRLSNLEVGEFLIQNNIKRDTELFAVANSRKKEGQKDLANFILSKSTKAVNDLIENTWRMHNASAQLEREKVSRMELIYESFKGDCVEGCDGQWLVCAHKY